jgi:hypothetical protein
VDWSDVLKAALSLFLVLTGITLAYLFVRMGGVFERLGLSVTRVTDEVVPILSKAQTSMDGVNKQLDHVDEIMLTAVHGAKGAEKTMVTVSSAATAPVRKLSGLAAGMREATATFRARRRAEAAARATAPPPPVEVVVPVPPPPAATAPPPAATPPPAAGEGA